MTTLPRNPDVIVIGAGAAGLAAAKSVMAAGQSVLVLEAADYVGGRCVTDTAPFDVPFDRGGSWLHSAPINPLADLANQNGVRLHKKPWNWDWVSVDGRLLTGLELADYRQYQDQMWPRIRNLDGELDLSVRQALAASPWQATAQNWVAQMQGGDAGVVSAIDVGRYAHADGDWLVEGGLGAFVRSLCADVPVKLNCPVSEVNSNGPEVEVTTPHGKVSAPKVIITVSTGVLRAEKIKFTPALPDAKQAALNGLPNGLLNKVGIEFDQSWAAAVEGQMADYHCSDDEFCTLLFGFYGSGLGVGFTAGRFGALLEKEGHGAATAFCIEGLKAVFGNDATRYIKQTTETAWATYEHTLGAYSYAKPDCADGRKALADPIDERLFFAGEATMTDSYATVHGAYLSGQRAAAEALARPLK